MDLRDPRTIPAQVRWVAKYLARGGSLRPWSGYHGPRDPSPRWGNSGYVPDPAAGEGGGGDHGGVGHGGLPFKGAQATAGGWNASGLNALAHDLHTDGAITAITAMNDRFHGGRGMHGRGLAMDLKGDPDEILRRVRTRMDAVGLKEGKDWSYLDEYRTRSARWSGPHFHVQFKSRAAADAYNENYLERQKAAKAAAAKAAEAKAEPRAPEPRAPEPKISMSRVGDEMMGRRFNDAGASAGSGKGHLHITMDGFPTGTRARASMDDLFKDVSVTQRRQVDSSIKAGPV
ncbi:hypothetical protein [Methylobacterium sp. WSM2598]|uniref:hypothetical protein n=1 Tax=Methylobacterium sp. WSM2598 TaxID=398261 RepID=UPI0003A86043|nr:hypothetical protein [Methylobacterium sp. WSM2598]